MISGMIGKRVIHVASGYDCVAMLTDDNELYAMGNNSYGQLGCEGTNPDYGYLFTNSLDNCPFQVH
jgi:alpha-tubulin suppressor-like RCC1 family protein